jgi:hypothetical protein
LLVSHQSKLADFTYKTNKNRSKFSFLSKYFIYFASKSEYFAAKLSKYFQKAPNIDLGLRLVKGFPI